MISAIEEYHKLELAEIYERTCALENLRFQLGTFIGTVNITVVAAAFTTQKVSLIFIAIALPLLNVLHDLRLRSILRSLYNRGLTLETKYVSDAQNAILHTYSPAKWSSFYSSIGGFWMPVIVAIAELIVGLALWYSKWNLF
jgi:hypothetical protein